MCRVAVRQAPRNRPDEAPAELKQEPVSLLYTQLQSFQAQPGLSMTEDDLDFENLFCEEDEEPGLQTGELDLLALFSDDASTPEQSMEQPLYMPHPAAAAAAAAGAAAAQAPAIPTIQAAPADQTVQQLQLQALMHQQQHLAAQQQAAYPAAVAAAAAMPQDVAMQQYQAAQMQAMLAAQAATLRQGQPVNKRGKTQAEVEEQQERIKKRRRESAQRSRARKNTYMKTLEVENKALKMENDRLRMELLKLTGKAGSISSSKPDTPSPQHMAMSDNSGEYSGSDNEECNEKSGSFSMPQAGNFFQLGL